jgi:hypothetical protein
VDDWVDKETHQFRSSSAETVAYVDVFGGWNATAVEPSLGLTIFEDSM